MPGLRLREAVPEDLGEVAALHRRLHPESAWPSDAACAAYFHEILFANPWRDTHLPSWVALDGSRIVGFLGVLGRRMTLGAKPVHVGVGCQFIVMPEKRYGLVALELLRRFFAGPQDLSVADGANEASRTFWEACGGIASPLHNLHWVRLLRPAAGLLQLAAEQAHRSPLVRVGAPFAALADACFAAWASPTRKPALAPEPLRADTLLEALEAHRNAFTLRPHYERYALAWLLGQAKAKRRYGTLESAVLRDASGRFAGWFLYYCSRQICEVLQLGTTRKRAPEVLAALFEHAASRGAAAIAGRLEPHFAPALAGKRYLMQNRGIWTLLHARDAQLLVPFLRGDVLFTRLEGEWWTRFTADPRDFGAPETSRLPGVPALGAGRLDLNPRAQLNHAIARNIEKVGSAGGVARE